MHQLPRKRVCFFNTTRFWGGGERWTLETALQLGSRGHEICFIAHPGSPLFERARGQGIDTTGIATTNRSGLNPLIFGRLKRLFRSKGIETVVFNGPNDLKAGGLSARSAGVQQRVYQRGLALPVRSHLVNRFLFSHVLTHIIANSEATRAALLADFQRVVPQPDVRVIFLGIDLGSFDYQEPVEDPHDDGPVVLGTVGRLAAEKDQSLLIEVAARLKNAGIPFDLRIAGEGGLEDVLRAQARDLGVGNEVQLLGFVDDIPTFLESVDIFVLSSRWEGFGLAIVEAGAAGKPVIAFNTTSTPEVIADGETGFLVQPGDLDAFTDRVLTLVEDRALRHRMGRAARKFVEERFLVERSIDEFERYVWG